MGEVLSQLPSLGIAGLLFVMWWFERQERSRAVAALREAVTGVSRVESINTHLLDVIRANTEALTALREELRAYRTAEQDWLGRISRQLESLELA